MNKNEKIADAESKLEEITSSMAARRGDSDKDDDESDWGAYPAGRSMSFDGSNYTSGTAWPSTKGAGALQALSDRTRDLWHELQESNNSALVITDKLEGDVKDAGLLGKVAMGIAVVALVRSFVK